MSAGGQKQNSESMAASFIDPTQLGFLKNLWGSASNNLNAGAMGANAQAAAGGNVAALNPAIGAAGRVASNPLAGQSSVIANLQRLGSLSGAQAEAQPALTTLAGLMDPSKQIAAQTSSLKSGLSSLFSEELNPAIKGTAIAAGGFGGGRQGVAQGQAVGQISDAFTQGLGDITAGANAQAASAAGGFADILSGLRSGVLGANGALSDVMGNAQSRSLDASSLLGQLTGQRQTLQTAGMNTRMQALQALAQVIGNPAMITQSQSKGKSGGWSFGFGS